MRPYPTYEVNYIEGDRYYPDGWVVEYADRYDDPRVMESFATKKEAVKHARKQAKMKGRPESQFKLLVRTKSGKISEETLYP